ncbi:hypothetical protein ATY27_13640 [Rheinheimera sp. F8]|nr:hypothetical protein ATY27_13640 [Rheinheimera sp. F8]
MRRYAGPVKITISQLECARSQNKTISSLNCQHDHFFGYFILRGIQVITSSYGFNGGIPLNELFWRGLKALDTGAMLEQIIDKGTSSLQDFGQPR